MIETVINFYNNHIAILKLMDLITILSFFITIFGFYSTYKNINKTKKLIKKSNEFVLTLNKISEIERILQIFEELKEYNRNNSPQLKLYSFVRSYFIEFKEFIPPEKKDFHISIQSLITFLTDCENTFEEQINNKEEIQILRVNQEITNHSVKIKEIIAQLRKNLENKYE